MLSALLTTAACTRPQEDTSKLSIKLPQQMLNEKAGTLSNTESLAHVVINVTGPGIDSPILLTWDAHSNDGAVLTAPEFKLEIPQGESRLIQVLAVYKTSEGSSMSFYYGDVPNVALKTATPDPVSVLVTSIGQGSPIISGTIWGRYLTANNVGPTGELFIRYNPGGGKPPLLIEKSVIANGWFEAMGLTGAQLEYVTDAGLKLFDGPVSLDDARFNPTAADKHVMRLSMPVHERNESYTGGVYDWRTEEAQILVYGWFGPSSDRLTKKVCRPSSGLALARLAKFLPGGAPNDLRSPMLNGQINTAQPTIAELLDATATSLSKYYVIGGDTNTPCSTGTEYVDKISMDFDMIDGQGRDGASPFFAVYKRLADTKAPFRLLPNTPAVNVTRVQAEFIPGLGVLFDKMVAYKRVGSGFGGDSETLSCRALAGGAAIAGFQKVAESGQSTSTLTASGFDMDIPLTGTEIVSKTHILICGSLGAKVYDRGMFIRSDLLSLLAYAPSQMAIKLSPAVANSACKAASIEVQNMLGNQVSSTSNRAISLTKTGSGELFAGNDSTCSIPYTSLPLNVLANGYSAAFHYKASGVGSQTSLTATSAGLLTRTKLISVVDSNQMAKLNLSQPSPMLLNQNACKEIRLESKTTSGAPLATETGAIQFVVTGTVAVYTDSGCSSAPVFSSSLSSGAKSLYVKSRDLTPSRVVFRYTSAQNIEFGEPVDIQTLPSTSPTKIAITATTAPYVPGACLPLSLAFPNDGGAPQTVSGLAQLSATSANGGSAIFYLDMNCTVTLAGGQLPISNTPSVTAYVVFANSSGTTANVSTNANLLIGTSLISGTKAYSVDPPPIATLVISGNAVPSGPNGTDLIETYTITNTSAVVAQSVYGLSSGGSLTDLLFSGGGTFPGGGTCTGGDLNPGQYCTIVLRIPAHGIGTYAHWFKIPFAGGGWTNTFNLSVNFY